MATTTKTPRATAANSFTQNGRVIYLNNKELLVEVKKSKEKGQMTDVLARMLQLLCARYARRGNFVNYSYNEDMQGYAMMMLVRTWNSFNPEKGSNPFAFFTQCIKNSFIQYLKHEKSHRMVRDALLIVQGLNPSYGYSEDGSDRSLIEDEQDFDTIKAINDNLSKTRYVDAPIERDEKGEEIVDVDIPDEEPDTPEEPEQQQ